MRVIAEGLHAAHRHGLVHRDIKPGNILVERGPEGLKPYLVDFGLAVDVGAPALTKTGVVVGTPRYMAPERVRGDAGTFDPRSDIYSLGATFYEFISGVPPFAGTSGLQVLVDVLNSEVVPLRTIAPHVPPELDAIVSKCCEPDPALRYPSARALTADLRRYLDGDQVLARPSTAVMRVARKARKHPRLAAAFALMLLTMVAIGGWGAYGYWRASRQAEVAQRLGQEVRDIEWLFRAAQMSPLHSLDREKRSVRERIARLTSMMDDVGSVAVGPGHYAIGRGLLALGDALNALEHLNLAWQSGYRTPDLATTLGLAHGEIFRSEVARAQRIEDNDRRAARIAALEAEHRDRALAFLEQGRSSAIVPAAYVEALMASHRNDRTHAIERADEAARDAPWLFEARLLPAYLEFNRAVTVYLAGNAGQAFEIAARADGYYAEAERIAASSVDAHVGRCAVAGLVLNMLQHGLVSDPAPFYRQAEQSCSRALVVDPEDPESHRLFGEAVRFWANNKVLARADPGDAYDKSAALTRRALELSRGRDLEAQVALADTFLDRAWWESRSGKDPRPAVSQAVATYEQALDVDPRNLSGIQNMGQAYLLRSRFERTAGLDPLESQNRAIDMFKRGLRADPSLASGYRTLARMAVERADEHGRRGLDVSAGLEDALRFIDELPGERTLPDRVTAIEIIRARLLR
jgi:serine/threonine-protein kinase